jgi:hypothetical protein
VLVLGAVDADLIRDCMISNMRHQLEAATATATIQVCTGRRELAATVCQASQLSGINIDYMS